MFLQGRVIIVWLSWLIGGICGVVILLVIICYCRLMPRHQKSFDEQYLKENYAIKENHAYTSQENYRMKHAEVSFDIDKFKSSVTQDQSAMQEMRSVEGRGRGAIHHMLDEIDSAANIDALKTRSLPAFLRPKPRPLSTEDDLQQLYAKVNLSKKYKNRMRNEHAAIIALSKSHSQFFDADAVIVYDQRTAL
ncbi:hypothetical protein SFRURICE_010918 [Spodoptera frugiperda]|nr:hypothetical protein SFRURICE_010918 [Spodoptera frugiperda]